MARDDPKGSYSARPTVQIGGQDLPLLSANLKSFRMREALGGMSSLELAIYDVLSFADGSAGFGATAASPLKLGATIKVYVGDTFAPQEVFDGVVTGIEVEAGPGSAPVFTLLAEDRLFKLRRKRRSKTYEAQSPADVVRAIAGDHGLEPQIGDGLDAPTSSWVQMNESDLAFLRRLLEVFDADLQLIGAKLQVVPIAAEARSTVPLRFGDTLLQIRVTADLAEQVAETRIGSFDPESGEAIAALATAGRMGPGTGSTGKQGLTGVADGVREHAGHFPPMTEQAARKVAEAAYGRRARRFVRAEGTAQGDGAIRVGSWLELSGINPFFVNSYNAVEVTHRFDLERGYLTDFVAECAYLGAGA
ncbi:phage late control D family protein [Sphingomonas kyeonggiensis]|uniref:Phage protein D n=1 Tax=Sphingomonas kyeonggiensis TaxID=1268553 RepID=A0A7W6JTC3_9SPHN|nr:contractile injection system protein, VgrG/Pvc8 family [Sphingomonas kyeonggiensis]MBB4099191.1 phage protein D [Sphingomonas kyeonggiensis]